LPAPIDSSKKAFLAMKLQLQYPRFIRAEGEKIANKVLLKPLHARMKSFGYSDKIINGTKIANLQVSRTGTMTFDVISDYESESGFSVADAREKGTERHFVKPVSAKALSWIAGGFIRAFSKGHWVSGITASNVIERTIAEKTPVVQARVDDATNQFIERSMFG